MKLLADKDIKGFFLGIACVMTAFLLLSQLAAWVQFGVFSLPLLLLFLLASGGVLEICLWYFRRRNKVLEQAAAQILSFLDGNTDSRIDCDEEGELYHLFHCVNTLAAVLNAHAANENREKEFLKNTISDISHQLKTPLAALNIYNGLLQGEAEENPAIQEFAQLSEQELDRIETLVQSLLKLTKLDAGSIVIEKHPENVAELLRDVELHFAYRAKQEQKEIVLSGADNIWLSCDRDWMLEAMDNLVKNALDHTAQGGIIQMEWRQLPSAVQILVKDNGSGIHPEDLHHIFKRFYRSRFSQDTQGIGLGLPLAKAIIGAHNGTITVDSELGMGTTFTISFRIPTEL